MNCQICDSTLSAEDLAVDTYVRVLQNCWQRWEQEAGEPLRRYGKAKGKSICTACGMVFGGGFRDSSFIGMGNVVIRQITWLKRGFR